MENMRKRTTFKIELFLPQNQNEDEEFIVVKLVTFKDGIAVRRIQIGNITIRQDVDVSGVNPANIVRLEYECVGGNRLPAKFAFIQKGEEAHTETAREHLLESVKSLISARHKLELI